MSRLLLCLLGPGRNGVLFVSNAYEYITQPFKVMLDEDK